MPNLVVEKGHQKGKSVPVPAGGTILLGRDSSTAFPLQDTMTSRMHCKIQFQEDGWYLSDLESMNGTYLNGDKVRESVKLEFGDLIKVGDTLFTFLSDDASAATLTGQRVGGYRVLDRVGRGGMGTVYKAEQIDLQRIVALKVISEEHTKDKEFVELFIHEARAAAKLNHPNIVQVYDVKRHNEYYYFSMEYVSGGSVQEILNKQKTIPHEQAVQMLLDAARGLAYAHSKGIVHRDVKPDNLMLSESGMIKIGDMGLARGLEEKIGPEEETSVIGTPHYIAPEQVLGRPADFRSDIYSLGATAYRMLAGVTPFNAPSVRDLVNKKVREDAGSIQEHKSDVPRPLCEIVGRMMVRDPDRRYQSMGEVAGAMEGYQRGRAGAAAEARRDPTTTVLHLISNRRVLVGTSVAGFLLVGGMALWALLGSPPSPPTSTTPPVEVVDPRAADQAFLLAQRFERERMDRKDPRSIEKATAGYGAILEKHPGTPAAVRAAELKASLEKLLRDVKARKRLELAEADEATLWKRATQPFSPRKPDLESIEAAGGVYEALARLEEIKGTPAEEEALARSAHIRRWRAKLEERRGEYDKVSAAAQESIDARKFREAAAALALLQDETRKAEMDCPFARDRWRGMLFDVSIAADLDKVGTEAKSAWSQQETEARSMARERNWEAAVKLLDAVIAESVEASAKAAKELRDTLEVEWAMATRKEEEEREAMQQALRAGALLKFAQESQAARDQVLRFDFRGAHLRMKTLRDSNVSDDLKARLDRRTAELERALVFKESLIFVIKAKDLVGGSPYKFKMDYVKAPGGLEGTIEDADDRSLRVRLGVGGAVDQLWSQFTPREFHEFVRKQWKYGKEQRRDANDQCNLAAVCMEFGLYEEAIEEMKWVLDQAKDPQVALAESVRRFCEEYTGRLLRGESAEFEELEAQKRLSRMDGFMKAANYAAVRAEIDVIRARYAKTGAFGAAQKRVEECLQILNKEGGESLNRAAREDRHRQILAKVQDEAAAARRVQPDVLQRLARIDDVFERNLHLGSVYSASGDYRTSTDRFAEARRQGEGRLKRKETGREIIPALAYVYGELYRNAVLTKDRRNADLIRNLGSEFFLNPDTGAAEPEWTTTINWLGAWSETIFPQEEKKLAKLRDEVRSTPDDPARIWALAQSLAEGTHTLTEARGLYLWLIEHHPDFMQVQSGNAAYRLGEIHYSAREMRDAIKRLSEVAEQHRDHPKAVDPGPTGLKRRLEEAYRIYNKMGFREKVR